MKNTIQAVFTLSITLLGTLLPTSVLAADSPHDYVVWVGKQATLASKLPKPAAPAAVAPKEASREYVVITGKQATLASKLPKAAAPAASKPSCRDYVVWVGKQATLASKAGIPSASPDMPYCCVTNDDCKMDKSCCPR